MKMCVWTGVLTLGVLSFGSFTQAATISGGNVQIGVDTFGQLITDNGTADVTGATSVGVRWVAPDDSTYEGLGHGCLCEGWGVSATVGGVARSGSSNNNYGTFGLTSKSFSSDSDSAVAVSLLKSSGLQITHSFALSDVTDNLYVITVTLANTGSVPIDNIVYRRTMDWDTSPRAFDEVVTIEGTANTPSLIQSSNDGFAWSNPRMAMSPIGSCGAGDFTDCAAGDQGSAFDFAIGSLAAGQSTSFQIYYGAAADDASARDSIVAVGASLFSLARSELDLDGDGRSDADPSVLTPTFIFAYSAGASPSAVPLPAGAPLLIGGLGALLALKRRRKQA